MTTISIIPKGIPEGILECISVKESLEKPLKNPKRTLEKSLVKLQVLSPEGFLEKLFKESQDQTQQKFLVQSRDNFRRGRGVPG